MRKAVLSLFPSSSVDLSTLLSTLLFLSDTSGGVMKKTRHVSVVGS